MGNKQKDQTRGSDLDLRRASSKPKTTSELKLLRKISRRIRQDLHDKQKPVEWLAFDSETSRATVRRLFDADRNLGLITLDRIAKALGYQDVVDLLNRL